MSIVQVFVTDDRALIGVDTEAQRLDLDIGFYEAPKLYALPHINAVLTGRGSVFFMSTLFSIICNCKVDFEELKAKLKDLATITFDQVTKNLTQYGVTDHSLFVAQSAVLVGWWPKLGGFHGVEVDQTNLNDGFQTLNVGQRYIKPGHFILDQFPTPTAPEAMAKIAAAQVDLIRHQYPNAAAGGRFIVAELTREGMSIREASKFPARTAAPGII